MATGVEVVIGNRLPSIDRYGDMAV